MNKLRLMIVAMSALIMSTTALAQRGQPGQPRDRDKDKPEVPKITKPVIGERAPELYAAGWLNSPEGAPTLDKLKSRVLVVFFFRTDDTSVDSIPTLKDVHKKFASGGVVVIGLTPQKKDAAESIVKGKEIRFIVGYEAQTAERYQVSAFPMVYLIDTAGVLVNRVHPQDDLEEQVRAQIARTPPVGADSAALKKRFDAAKTAQKEKDWGKAYTLAKDVRELSDSSSTLGKAADELLKQIEAGAKQWLEEAKEAAKKEDYEKACRILAELSVRMAGENVAVEAETEIGRLMGDAKIKPKLLKEKDEAKGRLANDQAADHEAAKRYAEAVKAYREVTEQFPDTQAARAAEQAIQRINTDPEVRKIIASRWAEEEADRWLDLGDRFAKVEMYDQARAYYERVVQSHPNSRAASKAGEKLTKLPKEQPPEQPAPPLEGEEETAEEAGEEDPG